MAAAAAHLCHVGITSARLLESRKVSQCSFLSSTFRPPSFHCHPQSLSSLRSDASPFRSISVNAGKLSRKQNVLQVRAEKSVLIVNTNSGGHAVIGFWLAKYLQSSGHAVTIFTVGTESDAKMKKPPFSNFSELRAEGVKTVWGSPAKVAGSLGSQVFDVVIDNNGKDLDTVKPVADWAKIRGTKQFLFVSSAGIYKSTEEPPHVEGDAVKSDAGHVAVEQYLSKLFPKGWSSFRPQYITGYLNNKDCEEWFFDRIVRDRPVPIPGSGLQMTVIAPVYDMAAMIALAVEKPEAAAGGIFNCVSDRAVTFDGLVRMCAKAAKREAKIVHYKPSAVGVDVKKVFPFRNQHFYSEPRAAKTKLGWQPVYSLQDVLNQRFKDYVASARYKKNLKFEEDDKILHALGVKTKVKVSA
eukprot:TRINITY_DN791_c0_g2_i1.p1 TRINITY_DN791_c0_g2~~TRINITY_DN791_c0_g2_i1.p1  ORF type:complete len:411 (+),score=80.10 TRINITY_DN791_c0_g2_i1:42-1274(+)